MDLIIKARLHNLFRAKDFNDKKEMAIAIFR